MGRSIANGIRLSLALAGVLSFCCLGVATVAGGAAITGGAAAVTAATTGAVGGLGGLVVTALATALPVLGIGAGVRWRRK